MLVSGTLELVGSHAVVVGVAVIDGSRWIDFYVIQTSCFILKDLLLLPKF